MKLKGSKTEKNSWPPLRENLKRETAIPTTPALPRRKGMNRFLLFSLKLPTMKKNMPRSISSF